MAYPLGNGPGGGCLEIIIKLSIPWLINHAKGDPFQIQSETADEVKLSKKG